jgi:hypothetical protein
MVASQATDQRASALHHRPPNKNRAMRRHAAQFRKLRQIVGKYSVHESASASKIKNEHFTTPSVIVMFPFLTFLFLGGPTASVGYLL